MRVKAKYIGLYNRTCWKYFHNVEEMEQFFNTHKMLKYISHDEGDEVQAEATERGFK